MSEEEPEDYCKGCGGAFKYGDTGPVHQNGECQDMWERGALLGVLKAARNLLKAQGVRWFEQTRDVDEWRALEEALEAVPRHGEEKVAGSRRPS